MCVCVWALLLIDFCASSVNFWSLPDLALMYDFVCVGVFVCVLFLH